MPVGIQIAIALAAGGGLGLLVGWLLGSRRLSRHGWLSRGWRLRRRRLKPLPPWWDGCRRPAVVDIAQVNSVPVRSWQGARSVPSGKYIASGRVATTRKWHGSSKKTSRYGIFFL